MDSSADDDTWGEWMPDGKQATHAGGVLAKDRE